MSDAAVDRSSDLSQLRGVGPKMLARLASMGLYTINDLLFHLPSRYEDRTTLMRIRDGSYGQTILVCGRIQKSNVQLGKRRQLVCDIADDSADLRLSFFHFYEQQRRRFQKTGARVLCYGQLRFFSNRWVMVHPSYQFLSDDEPVPLATHYDPVYPSCAGISQNMWRKWIRQALLCLAQDKTLMELLPEDVLRDRQWMDLKTALSLVHHPGKDLNHGLLESTQHPCQRRLAFEELLAQQLAMSAKRRHLQHFQAKPLPFPRDLVQRLLSQLPFTLTAAQQRVIKEIARDCEQAMPMMRLLQGDVGCGKTLVAAITMLCAQAAGAQAALMVPTELLAEQHWQNLSALMQPLGIAVGCLLGKHSASERKQCLQDLNSGSLQLVVGTHTLFQKQVVFHDLAVVIVDEQHRFGVHQRLAFWKKSQQANRLAHQLIMTATPIPRTLAMTAYADLETSIIDELPPGRQAIVTKVIDVERLDAVIERVGAYVKQGQQVYWVCTRIDSEDEGVTACEMRYAFLRQALPDCRIKIIHGQLSSDEKAKVMAAFVAGKVDVLVATTVIEVGVDVCNANLIIIENAERMGLAQLHQLRGRVGRGSQQAHCVLLYQSPLNEVARERLSTLRVQQDGFEIARRDLELRGPGEILGARQSGELNFRVANILRDHDMLADVSAMAKRLDAEEPERVDALLKRWMKGLGDYRQV